MGGWAGGSTRAWRKIRLAVLKRDNYVCQLRLAGCTIVASHAHHTLGRSLTGDSMAFIVASCPSCNLKVGDPQRPRRGQRSRAPQRTVYNRW